MRRVNNPRKIVVSSEARDKKFHQPFLYLSFYSQAGTAVDVSCEFSTAEKALGVKALKKQENELADLEALGLKLKEEVKTRHLVDKNIEKAWRETKSRKANRLAKSVNRTEERILKAKEAKAAIDLEKLKRSIFFVNRWKIIKEKKQECAEKV